MRRAFELRANVPAYDASYVALAELLGCELLTGDRRLAAWDSGQMPKDLLPAICSLWR
jgi:predicted nucleic acid-binding protein